MDIPPIRMAKRLVLLATFSLVERSGFRVQDFEVDLSAIPEP
jgi:hypothetical protein